MYVRWATIRSYRIWRYNWKEHDYKQRHIDGYKPLPGVWDYVKLILALVFLPFVGPIWALIKGCTRAFGKKILFYEVADQHVYKMDRRYSDGKRYIGTQKTKQKVQGLKSDVPADDVKRFNTHAYIYFRQCRCRVSWIWNRHGR